MALETGRSGLIEIGLYIIRSADVRANLETLSDAQNNIALLISESHGVAVTLLSLLSTRAHRLIMDLPY